MSARRSLLLAALLAASGALGLGRALAIEAPHDAPGGVLCSDCHSLHGGEGILPSGDGLEAVCVSCHNPTGPASALGEVANHGALDCKACHNPHEISESTDPHTGITAPNLHLLRSDLTPYSPGALNPAVFQSKPEHFAFEEANPPWDGICQACHTSTGHHTQDATSDHSHNVGTSCTSCHPHGGGFLPAGGCFECHSETQGSRRQVVEFESDGGGDFVRTSHHVVGAIEEADCVVCHYLGNHGTGTVKLKDPDLGTALIYSYDPADPSSVEPFCLGCHDAAGPESVGLFSDGQTPPDISNSGAWGSSAHNSLPFEANGDAPVSCLGDGTTSGCHANGHGSDALKLLPGDVTTTIDEACFGCHTDGGVVNDAISGPTYADDIEEAFSLSNVHDLDASFTAGSNTHTMQCTTCHNPHVVTGGYWDADLGLSPITLPDLGGDNPRAMGTTLWGAVAGEKMDDQAGSGVYSMPNGANDAFTGADLPDYVTFCMTCHSSVSSVAINWTGDRHGNTTAYAPSDGGTCPNWFSCGKAIGWDNDDCIGTEAECWPPVPRGRGRTVWTRPASNWTVDDPGYTPQVRFAGGNYVLSCTDCHEAHGGQYRMMRQSVNGNGNNPTNWQGTDGICNACHYSWSSWHAGMSCGTASCHVSNSIHGMGSAGGGGGSFVFDPDLVLNMQFNNSLVDSGDFRLDGIWRVTSGSYAAGHSGNAIVVDDDPIEVGTENEYWSTDAGRHGTWIYTEMKYAMTLEAWVYPTDDTANERLVLAKHTYSTGGYALTLKKVDGTLRAGLKTSMTGGGPDYGNYDSADCNGLRGAFSSVHVPLNRWTHISAVFDQSLPDRDDADGSVGRVRIYVNGEDVTTSYADVATCYAQPGSGQDVMFPHSDLSPDNESYCYAGHWCASALSVGGVNWSSPGSNYIGRIDDLKIWNITQGPSHFDSVDEGSPPRPDTAVGLIGSDVLDVTFSEGVYGLEASDLSLDDADDGRTVVAVTHVDGESTATLTLSSPLDAIDDLLVDTLSIAGTVLDEYGTSADSTAVLLTLSSDCPTGTVSFDLNEPAGSAFAQDDSGILYGEVYGVGALTGSALDGDGATTYLDFQYNGACMQANTDLSLDARVRPENLVGSGNYIRRVFARDGGGANYQLSVWRNPSWVNFNPPDGVASFALWVKPEDNHGGLSWKVVLSDYDLCPVVTDHWYEVQVTWDASDPIYPGTILVDDQGTDGLDSGEGWSGFIDCTDTAQRLVESNRYILPGDTITASDGAFAIGANTNNHANNVFDGLIDWIVWAGQ